MKRRSANLMQNLLLLKQIKDAQALEKRKRRLFNRIYRKTFFFKATWVCRLLYFITFFVVTFTHNIPKTARNEIVDSKRVDIYQSHSRRGPSKTKELIFTTDFGTYNVNFSRGYTPSFEPGDTLIIEYNYYNKAIFFTKSDWSVKYWIPTNIVFYYIVLFGTFLSFFYNDGFYKQTREIILVICIINFLTIGFYFLV